VGWRRHSEVATALARSPMMIHVRTFVISAVVSGVFFHFVTRQPMPWWPDSAIMGLTCGTIVTLAAVRSRAERDTNRRLWNALKAVVRRRR
jgi:hypothetical protein